MLALDADPAVTFQRATLKSRSPDPWIRRGYVFLSALIASRSKLTWPVAAAAADTGRTFGAGMRLGRQIRRAEGRRGAERRGGVTGLGQEGDFLAVPSTCSIQFTVEWRSKEVWVVRRLVERADTMPTLPGATSAREHRPGPGFVPEDVLRRTRKQPSSRRASSSCTCARYTSFLYNSDV